MNPPPPPGRTAATADRLRTRSSDITDLSARAPERQLTAAPHGHLLTHAGVWSPDGNWIVYDTREDSERFEGTLIEQVSVQDGEIQRLYESADGAACGVVSYSPVDPRIVFIHGPEHPTADWKYGFTHRRGVLLDVPCPGRIRALDAMTYAPPYTPGALRGGTHLHLFSGDGRWVSFTYEDEVLERLGLSRAAGHDLNQRNVGVAVPAGPVRVSRSHPRNQDGDYFSVVVTRTAAEPRPGSDEIARACEEAWIGVDGYRRSDGSRQRRALAFQGLVTAADGSRHSEVFVADLPDDLTIAGAGPLEGTPTLRPAPPLGMRQRRLTFTSDERFPGIQGPRHWLRSSPDGGRIAFLRRDDSGVAQFWLVGPEGGSARPLTFGRWSVASAFTWSPDGRYLAHVMDNSVCVTSAGGGRTFRLTSQVTDRDAPLPVACVFSPEGRRIAYSRRVPGAGGWHSQIFVVDVPLLDETDSLP